MVGRRVNGKPDRRVLYGRTRAEAQRQLDDLRRRAGAGLLGPVEVERGTVASYLARWLEAVRLSLRPSTWKRYDELLRLHVVPTLGRMRLAALRPDAVQRLYAARLEAGLAPRTVHHIHTVLHTALAQAVRWGYVARNVIRSFKGLLERAGLPRTLRVHDLRHTTASLLLALGTDVPTTAAILGHAQSSTTLNAYAHAMPSRLTAAAHRLGAAIQQEQAGLQARQRAPALPVPAAGSKPARQAD